MHRVAGLIRALAFGPDGMPLRSIADEGREAWLEIVEPHGGKASGARLCGPVETVQKVDSGSTGCADFLYDCGPEDISMAAAGMTKTQLTAHLAERMGEPITKKAAAGFLEHLASIAVKETKKNGIFVLPGIGRLVKAQRKARMGRNPATGEPIKIKAKTVVKFRLAKAVKDAISPKVAA